MYAFVLRKTRDKGAVAGAARSSARPEYKDLLTVDDFTPERPIRVYLVYDGDIFDLGDRQIEVIEVGGIYKSYGVVFKYYNPAFLLDQILQFQMMIIEYLFANLFKKSH